MPQLLNPAELSCTKLRPSTDTGRGRPLMKYPDGVKMLRRGQESRPMVAVRSEQVRCGGRRRVYDPLTLGGQVS
jgi:hypothetical protein